MSLSRGHEEATMMQVRQLLRRYKRFVYGPSGKLKLLTLISGSLFVGLVIFSLLSVITFVILSFGLPDPSKIVRSDGYSTIIYDRNGKVLYDVFDRQNRIPLELNDIPKYAQQATISIEDKDFYKHQGFSVLGIVRSAFNILTFQGFGGGSTLTQQLVKNVLLSPEKSIFRKIREVILANQIEQKYSKDQILLMYLNETPYGGSSYGIESAAKTYFGKSAKDLTLVESAILAGLPQQPTNLSPFGKFPTAYVDRTKSVLRRMREDGVITLQQEADAAKTLGAVQFATVSAAIRAPHFVFYVKDQLEQKFGAEMVEGGGLRVTTSLDWDLQEQAEKIVNEEVKKIKPLKVSNGAAVVLNPKTGEILSMIGSYDYFDKDYGSYNVALAQRQPGSAGKPFIYAAALTKGYTPATLLFDAKTSFPSGRKDKPDYIPENYDLKYRGPIQMRFALGNSVNTTAVKMTALVGLPDIMKAGFEAGLSTWEPTTENMNNVGLSLALGGREVKLLELTQAYGVFAAGGVKNDTVGILKVTDSKGKTLFEYKPVNGKKVYTPEVSFLISNILSDNNARKDVFGEVNLLQIPGRTIAVKTGTTDQKRDNWTVGFDPNVVVGVWVGNNDNTIMAPVITSGVTGAAPIWNKIMKIAVKSFPPLEFNKPDGVVSVSIDSLGGGLPHSGDQRTEYFLKGTEPVSVSPVYKKFKISKANGKLANDLEIKLGDYEEKEFLVFTENDPVSETGKNRWQEAIDKWIVDNKKDDSRFHPPTEMSDAKQNDVVVRVENPSDHQQINSSEVSVKARAYSQRDIVKFTLEVDGSEKITKGGDRIDEKINLTDGKHRLIYKAVDSAGNSATSELNIGVNQAWDYSPPATGAAVLQFRLANRDSNFFQTRQNDLMYFRNLLLS